MPKKLALGNYGSDDMGSAIIYLPLLNRNFNNPNELIKTRDRAIVEMLFSTGLRISELCKLNQENVNIKLREFSVLGKGKKIRTVFLTERACN